MIRLKVIEHYCCSIETISWSKNLRTFTILQINGNRARFYTTTKNTPSNKLPTGYDLLSYVTYNGRGAVLRGNVYKSDETKEEKKTASI